MSINCQPACIVKLVGFMIYIDSACCICCAVAADRSSGDGGCGDGGSKTKAPVSVHVCLSLTLLIEVIVERMEIAERSRKSSPLRWLLACPAAFVPSWRGPAVACALQLVASLDSGHCELASLCLLPCSNVRAVAGKCQADGRWRAARCLPPPRCL
eukprot:COSAG06_NODE_2155_length_7457_cov_2.421038_11_plen_156_part_00